MRDRPFLAVLERVGAASLTVGALGYVGWAYGRSPSPWTALAAVGGFAIGGGLTLLLTHRPARTHAI